MNKKALLGISLVVLFSLSVLFGPVNAQDQEINIAFNINLLSPNTSPARNQWSLLMEQQLPKIGIGITFHESTGWGNIAPRTWSYPVGVDYDYIPTYAEGGFDILFVGWSWGLDWDPTGLYDIASTSPAGDNFYQYANPTYDSILTSYLTELDEATRIDYAFQLQDILYEDQPAICLVYPRSLFGFRTTVSGVNGILIASSNHRAEYWDNDDGIIKYGIPADLREPNIFVAESFYDVQWMQTVYGNIAIRDESTAAWEPQIADSWTLVPNVDNTLLNITVDLNPNARFSDGEYVTAEDVKYTYELHMTPAVGSSSYSFLNTWFVSNDSIEIVTPGVGGTLNFMLDDFYVFAANVLNFGVIDMFKGDGTGVQELIGAHGYSIFNDVPGLGNAGWNLVKGAGPFMVESYDSVNSIVKMVPNTFYVGAAPLLDELYLTFVAGKDSAVAELIAGNIDIMDAQYFPVLADFEGQTEVEGVLIKDPSHQEMGINLKHPQFGTGELCPIPGLDSAKAIRKAISHAVPRQTIVDEILEGLGAPGITATPDSVVGFNDQLEPYAYDLDLAIEYMEDAGYVIIPPPVTTTGIAGLVFLAFLGLASVLAFRRFRK
ncbi:MAG: ABC transporter substrate-binding protein [Candidatus Heimdallarchaeaceae archaeon]